MNDNNRLNNIIRAWTAGRPAIGCFAQADRQTAIELSTAPYDGLVFEMEHNPWDVLGLQDSLQYLLNRKQIATSGSLVPAVTPMVRIPANGNEKNQSFAKQALDRGVYGVVWPHISDADQAYNAVAACRYWGLSQQEYYAKADVWPLNPEGEILVVIMIESMRGVTNLDEILDVPGIACILIGEGDLSQDLGYPRQYDHPEVEDAMKHIVAICKKHGVPVGHPHVTTSNVARVLAQGYQLILSAPVRTYEAARTAAELGAKQSAIDAGG